MEYFAYSQKEFVYKYIVMLSDTDLFKHMSYANYLRLMFLASDALFMPVLKGPLLDQIRLRVTKTSMQFKHQTTVGENVLIKVNASGINPQSFILLYTFVAEDTANLIGLGRQNFILEKVDGKEKVTLPGVIVAALSRITADEEHLVYKY